MWDKFTSALLFVFYKKEAKLMPPGVLLSRKKSPKWLFLSAAPLRTQLEKLTALPRLPSWIKGPTSKGK